MLHVNVRDGEDRRLDLVYRLYNAVRLRSVGEQHVFTSLRQDAEHEAFVALWAGQAGVPVPKPVAVTSAGASGMLLADEWIEGVPLDRLDADQLTDDVLRRFWRAVGALHDQHIAHRALRAEVAMVDAGVRVWLVGFDDAEVDSPPQHLAADVAEALASVALVAGAERAVGTAASALGSAALATSLPYLQPLALSPESQRRLHGKKGLLQDLSKRVVDATDSSPVELARLERVSPRTLAAVLGAFVAMWVLLPKLANAGDAFEALRHARPGYLVAMLPLTLLLYVGSTFELLGACSRRLPFFSTYRCQMAAAFMNRVTPSNVGGMAVNARYLQVSGVDAATATATVGLTSATEAIVNVALVFLFFTWAGRGTSGASVSLPSSTAVRVVVAVILTALVVSVLTPPGRKMLKQKVLPFLRGVRTSLAEVARSPVRLLAMFGGGFGRALTDFAALVVAIAAFGSVPALAPLGAAYIGASVVAERVADPGRRRGGRGSADRRSDQHRRRGRAGDAGRPGLPAHHLLAGDAARLDLVEGDGEARRGMTAVEHRNAPPLPAPTDRGVRWRLLGLCALVAVGAAALAAWALNGWTVGSWLAVHAGTDDLSGPWYDFWSGSART